MRQQLFKTTAFGGTLRRRFTPIFRLTLIRFSSEQSNLHILTVICRLNVMSSYLPTTIINVFSWRSISKALIHPQLTEISQVH